MTIQFERQQKDGRFKMAGLTIGDYRLIGLGLKMVGNNCIWKDGGEKKPTHKELDKIFSNLGQLKSDMEEQMLREYPDEACFATTAGFTCVFYGASGLTYTNRDLLYEE